jgi:hypothetical protein
MPSTWQQENLNNQSNDHFFDEKTITDFENGYRGEKECKINSYYRDIEVIFRWSFLEKH